MIFTIRKGEHRAEPNRFGLWYKKKSIEREVIFHFNCKYTVKEVEDIEDVNKLFGLGFATFSELWGVLKGIFSQEGIPDILHHTESARYGWVYNPDRNNIELFAYCYVGGKRIIQSLLHVPIGVKVKCSIFLENGYYIFIVETPNVGYTARIPYSHSKKWSYLLNLYFGGNEVPDHDMTVVMNKL